MITTVILDFGGVLAYPQTGNWFITPNTKRIMGMRNILNIFLRYPRIGSAFHTAYEYLNENHILHTEQEEYLQFVEFYKRFFNAMGIKHTGQELYEKLSYDVVFNDEKICLYDDVKEVLRDLKRHFRVVVLSDTWPSLKRILKNNDILPILDALFMSCDYGETKESTKLFEITLTELGVEPERAIFIDDSIDNLENAKKTGLIPVLMDRNGKTTNAPYPVIFDLHALKDIIRCY